MSVAGGGWQEQECVNGSTTTGAGKGLFPLLSAHAPAYSSGASKAADDKV